jgi:hypothetical protein
MKVLAVQNQKMLNTVNALQRMNSTSIVENMIFTSSGQPKAGTKFGRRLPSPCSPHASQPPNTSSLWNSRHRTRASLLTISLPREGLHIKLHLCEQCRRIRKLCNKVGGAQRGRRWDVGGMRQPQHERSRCPPCWGQGVPLWRLQFPLHHIWTGRLKWLLRISTSTMWMLRYVPAQVRTKQPYHLHTGYHKCEYELDISFPEVIKFTTSLLRNSSANGLLAQLLSAMKVFFQVSNSMWTVYTFCEWHCPFTCSRKH